MHVRVFLWLIDSLTLNSIPLFRNTTIWLFTHLLNDILIVSSIWWIMNKAAINIHVQVQHKILPVLGKYQIIWFLGHIGSHRVEHNWSDLSHMHIVRIHVVLFKKKKTTTAKLPFKLAEAFNIPTGNEWVSVPSQSHSHLMLSVLLILAILIGV